jgi:hypothetical protein
MKEKLKTLIADSIAYAVFGLIILGLAACLLLPAFFGIVKFLAFWRIAFGN